MQKNNTEYGSILGNLQIYNFKEFNKKFIAIYCDKKGLESFGKFLIKLSKEKYSRMPGLPKGERIHTHIYPNFHLSKDSSETIIGRLDAKGIRAFPKNFIHKT